MFRLPRAKNLLPFRSKSFTLSSVRVRSTLVAPFGLGGESGLSKGVRILFCLYPALSLPAQLAGEDGYLSSVNLYLILAISSASLEVSSDFFSGFNKDEDEVSFVMRILFWGLELIRIGSGFGLIDVFILRLGEELVIEFYWLGGLFLLSILYDWILGLLSII